MEKYLIAAIAAFLLIYAVSKMTDETAKNIVLFLICFFTIVALLLIVLL